MHPDPHPEFGIATRLAAVAERIAGACARAGRAPDAVQLVAVAKTHPDAAVAAALAAGQRAFAENRVQEAAAKYPALRPSHPALRLHLIGPLQTNKARDAVRLCDVIETLDRAKLAAALADAIAREGRAPELLVQVNTGAEPQKAGVLRAELEPFLDICREAHGLVIAGLMAIPPAAADPRADFEWLAAAARRLGLATVSMGMSGDFEAAVECGATRVRVGSAIFGTRG